MRSFTSECRGADTVDTVFSRYPTLMCKVDVDMVGFPPLKTPLLNTLLGMFKLYQNFYTDPGKRHALSVGSVSHHILYIITLILPP